MTNDRATSWSLTINNPTDSDEEGISLARQKGWRVEGQKERGDNGTEHYQLMVKTPQVRFSAVKKLFPRAHIEIARNVSALEAYVNKADTRIGSLPSTSEQYPSASKFWCLLFNVYKEWNYIDMTTFDWWTKETGSKDIDVLFDEAVSELIKRGYFVESMAINPQVRGSFKRYHKSILYRTSGILSQQEKSVEPSPQTDRQTDTETVYADESSDDHNASQTESD